MHKKAPIDPNKSADNNKLFILSTSLYGWNPAIPFVGVVIIMAAAALFSCLHPHLRLRRGANQPSTCAR